MVLSFDGVKHEVQRLRREATRDAKRHGRWTKSWGAMFSSVAGDTGPCEPFVQQECYTWDGTKRELQKAIAAASANPTATDLYLCGRIDAADTFDDLHRWDAYVGAAGEWELLVWSREATTQESPQHSVA